MLLSPLPSPSLLAAFGRVGKSKCDLFQTFSVLLNFFENSVLQRFSFLNEAFELFQSGLFLKTGCRIIQGHSSWAWSMQDVQRQDLASGNKPSKKFYRFSILVSQILMKGG